MTTLEASHLLFEWYRKNDSFESTRDFSKVILISENEDEEKALLDSALDGLEKVGLLKAQEFKKKKYWFLAKPVGAFEQTVSMNGEVAGELALIINDFCVSIKDDTDYCDPVNISPKDLKNLILICNHYKKNLTNS